MTWWGWVIAGAILFGAELSFVSAHFYLVFIGSRGDRGRPCHRDRLPPPWAQWALFAVLAIISMLAFRSRLYQRFRGAAALGEVRPRRRRDDARALRWRPARSCQTEYGGTFWTVQNDTDVPIPSGTRVRITSVRDLTLLVRPEP